MLGEERLDLENSRARPVLEPRIAEVVFDLVKAAFTHAPKYRQGGRTTPWAERLIRGVVSPTNPASAARLPPGEPVEFRVEPLALRVPVRAAQTG